MGLAAKTLDMADATPEQVARAGNLLVITSTRGDGDPPQRAEAFYAALLADTAPRFGDVRFAILALGDRAYAKIRETSARREGRSTPGWRRLADSAWRRGWIAMSITQARRRSGSRRTCGSWKARQAPPSSTWTWRARRQATRRMAPHQSVRGRDQRDHQPERQRFQHRDLSRGALAGGVRHCLRARATQLGFVPTNDPALIDDVLMHAGLAYDAALREALSEQLNLTTPTREQIAN